MLVAELGAVNSKLALAIYGTWPDLWQLKFWP